MEKSELNSEIPNLPNKELKEKFAAKVIDDSDNFFPLLESMIEDTLLKNNISVNTFIEKFKLLHNTKIQSLNLEQIDFYCEELLKTVEKDTSISDK
ncbi:hypothetical protein cand_003090 [Cryptosporidium andersoni]|uniref:Uncharacterized protein n=1 Tax=Cryptosporidium andersoni TaxID=117008 RepID=A0A1J4MGU0_9CRYT|nr:hypothetical protein cand_003090 [Cryptosporidium andersoni]